MGQTVQIVVGALVALIGIEHALRLNNIAMRPSVALDACALAAARWFREFGRVLALVSSILDKLRLYELGETAWALIEPALKIASSCLWIGSGYAHEAIRYTHPSIVWLGSLLLATATIYALSRSETACRVGASLWKNIQYVLAASGLLLIVYVTAWKVDPFIEFMPRFLASIDPRGTALYEAARVVK